MSKYTLNIAHISREKDIGTRVFAEALDQTVQSIARRKREGGSLSIDEAVALRNYLWDQYNDADSYLEKAINEATSARRDKGDKK